MTPRLTADEPGPELPALPAATVMLVRDTARSGIEVLVLRRTTAAAFAAGFYVFPGGKVDPVDGGPAVEPFSEGLDDATASALLGLDAGGLAYWVAAIRECFEEAGLLLARRRDGGPAAPRPGDRMLVHGGTLSMVELCERDDLVLETGRLRYVAHWVTPAGEQPRRFDTRFFLAAAPADQEGVHDDAETVDSRWIRPAEAVRQADEGELMLLPPTIANLRFLAGCADVADALAAADAAGPPPRILPELRYDESGAVVGVTLADGTEYPLPGRR